VKIHVIGAGNVGGNVIRAATRAGHTVTVGVRSPEKIQDLLDGSGAVAADMPADAEIVVSTIPSAAAVELLPTLELGGKVLIDTSNPLTWSGGPVHSPPAGFASGGEYLQSLLPNTRVVKAFNTFGAEHISSAADGERPLDHFFAGGDDDAKARVSAFFESLNMRPIDLGPLRNAATVEHLAVAWIHLAMPGGWGRDIQLAVLGGAD